MKKVLTFILAVLPAIIGFFYTISLIALGVSVAEGWVYGVTEDILVLLMLVLTLVLLVFLFGAMIYFFVDTCRNKKISGGMKILWCFLHYQFNAFAFPVYWFLYLRKD